MHPYARAWRDYQWRRRLYFLAAAIYLPVFFAMVFTRPAPWSGAVVIAGMLIMAYLWERVTSFACPRCKSRLRRKTYFSSLPSSCSRCNLPVGSLPTEAADVA
jgi:hypothetical protein